MRVENVRRGNGVISKKGMDMATSYLGLRTGELFVPEKFPGVKGFWLKETSAYARNEYGTLVPMYAESLVEKITIPSGYVHTFIKVEDTNESADASSCDSNSGE